LWFASAARPPRARRFQPARQSIKQEEIDQSVADRFEQQPSPMRNP
jgi:hypothetical protein